MATAGTAKLIEEIASKIRDKIASGEFRPGDRLKQEVLAEEFQVSRTPIREALSRLEAQGIITQEQRRSAIVSVPSTRDIAETYQIRAELEALAADLAARWITDLELAELRESHDQFVTAVRDLRSSSKEASQGKKVLAKREEASRRWIATNAKFHSAIGKYSHNIKLTALLEELRAGATQGAMAASATSMDFHRMETNIRHHETILRALEERDRVGAKEAMRAHVLESSEYIIGLLSHTARGAPI